MFQGKGAKPTRSQRPCRLGNQKKATQDLQGFKNLVGLRTRNRKNNCPSAKEQNLQGRIDLAGVAINRIRSQNQDWQNPETRDLQGLKTL
ncbi:hypothetical protein DHD05_00870 [Arenibacter sp. N53]|nr:hypothetical protein [Arenibacter sp. N53]